MATHEEWLGAAGERRLQLRDAEPGLHGPRGRQRLLRDEDGRVFHTYSAYARGIDLLNAAYNYIDLVPKGRDEEGRPPQFWVRRHDEYDR